MRLITDKEAMDDLTDWIYEHDPVLDASVPNWVWELVSLVDDLIEDTGRNG